MSVLEARPLTARQKTNTMLKVIPLRGPLTLKCSVHHGFCFTFFLIDRQKDVLKQPLSYFFLVWLLLLGSLFGARLATGASHL